MGFKIGENYIQALWILMHMLSGKFMMVHTTFKRVNSGVLGK